MGAGSLARHAGHYACHLEKHRMVSQKKPDICRQSRRWQVTLLMDISRKKGTCHAGRCCRHSARGPAILWSVQPLQLLSGMTSQYCLGCQGIPCNMLVKSFRFQASPSRGMSASLWWWCWFLSFDCQQTVANAQGHCLLEHDCADGGPAHKSSCCIIDSCDPVLCSARLQS